MRYQRVMYLVIPSPGALPLARAARRLWREFDETQFAKRVYFRNAMCNSKRDNHELILEQIAFRKKFGRPDGASLGRPKIFEWAIVT